MTPRIKICGITNRDDALLAAELGADMLGFIFYAPSRRAVSLSVAMEICRAVKGEKVGVFVNAPATEIERYRQECGLDTVQLHGAESPEFCRQVGGRRFKAFRVRDESSLAAAAEYDVDALLLDTYTAQQPGGTGQTFDWSLAVQAKRFGRPIILSGGLTPANVAAAIATVQPYAVDVASGVEASPGRKDPVKLREFIKACRRS